PGESPAAPRRRRGSRCEADGGAVTGRAPPGQVAHWDFTNGPDLTDRLTPQRTLQRSESGSVSWRADATVGGCMVFAGDGGHLHLPPEDVGDLDMSGADGV